MVERIVLMHIEDNMVTFEKENGNTINYPQSLLPAGYVEGDIIKSVIHNENHISFLELDTDEMNRRRENLMKKKSRLRNRTKKNTNKA